MMWVIVLLVFFRKFRSVLDAEVKKDDGSSFRSIIQRASEMFLFPEETLDLLPGNDSIKYHIDIEFIPKLYVHLYWCKVHSLHPNPVRLTIE